MYKFRLRRTSPLILTRVNKYRDKSIAYLKISTPELLEEKEKRLITYNESWLEIYLDFRGALDVYIYISSEAERFMNLVTN